MWYQIDKTYLDLNLSRDFRDEDGNEDLEIGGLHYDDEKEQWYLEYNDECNPLDSDDLRAILKKTKKVTELSIMQDTGRAMRAIKYKFGEGRFEEF